MPLAAVIGGGLKLPREFRARALTAGSFDAAGFMLLATAISLGPLAVASVTVAQSGTMASLLGLVALGERLRGLQVVGVVLTLVAVTLLALS